MYALQLYREFTLLVNFAVTSETDATHMENYSSQTLSMQKVNVDAAILNLDSPRTKRRLSNPEGEAEAQNTRNHRKSVFWNTAAVAAMSQATEPDWKKNLPPALQSTALEALYTQAIANSENGCMDVEAFVCTVKPLIPKLRMDLMQVNFERKSTLTDTNPSNTESVQENGQDDQENSQDDENNGLKRVSFSFV